MAYGNKISAPFNVNPVPAAGNPWDLLTGALKVAVNNTEANMLRAILNALRAGLRRTFGFCGFIFSLPFLLFGGRPRAQAVPAVDIAALKERMAGPGMPAAEFLQSQMRDAQIAWSWIAGSLLDRQTRPFPSQLSKNKREWVQGLSLMQLDALKSAGSKGVFEHAAGKRLITGVPPVQPLKPVVLRFPALPKVKDPTAPRMVRV